MLRSSRPRSSTMPVAGSGMPRTVTSARNEWPWISSLAAPSVVPGSACAASKRNDFVNSHILRIQFLSDTERFVGLQAEPPLRMAQTIVDRACGVLDHIRSVHRLQREALEGKIDKGLWRCIRLRINQLEFMTSAYHEVCAGFGADANPVHALGWLDRAIGLDADFETTAMQRIDKGLVHLQQWLAASQYRVMVCAGSGPLRGNGIGELPGRGIATAQRAVGSDKIGVAKPARRRGAVLLAAAPEIAAGEPAKHRRAAGVCAFALQGRKDFLDRVTQPVVSSNCGTGLPQCLTQCHRHSHRDIERAQARLDRDHQPRVGFGDDLVRDPCGLTPEHKDVGRAVAVVKIRTDTLGCEQDQPVALVVTPLFEFWPRVVSRDGYLVEIVHAGPAEVPVGHRKTRRLDDMGSHIQTRAETKNRPGVLRDVGLEKRNLHSVIALGAPMKCLNKTSLGADLVHCTLASR